MTSHAGSDPTEALIAEAKRRARKRRGDGWLKEADMLDRLIAALEAAGVASQEVIDDAADEQDDLRLHMLAPQPVIDEDALAEVIEAEIEKLRHETRLYPDIYKAEVARAVAEWLKGQGGEGRESTDAN